MCYVIRPLIGRLTGLFTGCLSDSTSHILSPRLPLAPQTLFTMYMSKRSLALPQNTQHSFKCNPSAFPIKFRNSYKSTDRLPIDSGVDDNEG